MQKLASIPDMHRPPPKECRNPPAPPPPAAQCASPSAPAAPCSVDVIPPNPGPWQPRSSGPRQPTKQNVHTFSLGAAPLSACSFHWHLNHPLIFKNERQARLLALSLHPQAARAPESAFNNMHTCARAVAASCSAAARCLLAASASCSRWRSCASKFRMWFSSWATCSAVQIQ